MLQILVGKNIYVSYVCIINANNNEYDLKNIHNEIINNMDNINLTDTNIINELEI